MSRKILTLGYIYIKTQTSETFLENFWSEGGKKRIMLPKWRKKKGR